MKRLELEQIIEEEIYNYLDEKSVPQPYDRKNRRRMSKAQISNRKKIGDKMKSNPKTVARLRKKYGDEWEDYLWASASSIALGGGFKKKSSSKNSSSPKPTKSAKKTPAKKTPTKSAPTKKRPKMTAAKRKNIKEIYNSLVRKAKTDGNIKEYVSKLEEKFSILAENNKNFDAVFMTEVLHALTKKITDTTGESV